MTIWDPAANFISGQVAQRQRYRCVVDGSDMFDGEDLPVGTEEEILAWIAARYRVIGALLVIAQDCLPNRIVWQAGMSAWFGPGMWEPAPMTKRYLVEVGEGDERMFVLHPVPDGLLEWHPGRALT